jgi:uncharacterized protein YprB with RNaseH-like and TPR domain
MKHGVYFPLYKELEHIDVYYMARGKLCLHRKSLDVVARHLGIPGKTHVDGDLWMRATIHGDKKALQEILSHNKADVIVLEKVYHRLKDYCMKRSRSV